jgi:hypothetical protein
MYTTVFKKNKRYFLDKIPLFYYYNKLFFVQSTTIICYKTLIIS